MAELTGLPWPEVPATTSRVEYGHGRREQRSIKIVTVAAGIGFPHAARAFQITRKNQRTDLPPVDHRDRARHHLHPRRPATPRPDAGGVRGHWTIENRLHWTVDRTSGVSYDEDRSQTRTGNGPRTMASLRNLAITALRLAGHQNLAHATRHYNRPSDRPITLLLTS